MGREAVKKLKLSVKEKAENDCARETADNTMKVDELTDAMSLILNLVGERATIYSTDV